MNFKLLSLLVILSSNHSSGVGVSWWNPALIKQLIMRITSIVCFLILAIMQVSAEVAHAQSISLNKTNAPLYEIIDEIRNQTGYDFIINMDLLKQAGSTTISVKNASLKDVLTKCLIDRPLTFEIKENKTVIIKAREPGILDQVKTYLSGTKSLQQQTVIKGVVTDSVFKPMPGVSVSVRGKKITQITSSSGAFEFSIPEKEAIVVFSFVGMETREVKISGTSVQLRVVMKPQQVKLSDVVITGYSNVRKESFTGNSIKVNQEQILKVGNRNVIEVLQVFDPSFRLEVDNLRGSDPNNLPEFYVRGRSGIGQKALDNPDISQAALVNNPNLPVFIMDGYEVTADRVYDYDPMRIKSITILKDAAATAVYGSRAANGVIVIETIPPQPGKLQIGYNLVSSITAPDLSDYNLMNASEKLEAERLAGYYDKTDNVTTTYSRFNEYMTKLNQIAKGVNTDWIAQPVTNELNQKHTINIDGGTNELRFGFFMKYDNQNGVMKESRRDRKGVGLILDYRLNKLQIRNDVTFDVVKLKNSPYGSFSDYTWKSPYDEIYDRNGEVIQNNNNWHSGIDLPVFNPLYEVFKTNNFSKGGYENITDNLSLNYFILPKLQLKGQLSVSRTQNHSNDFIDPASATFLVSGTTDYSTVGSLKIDASELIKVNTNLFANYVNSVNGHNMNFSVGLNTRESTQTGNSQLYTGFPSGSQNSPSFASKIVTRPSFYDNHTRLLGAFTALNYSYKDIYLLDVSSRIDGSSEFGTEKKYAPFWSLGTGINFHKYGFWKTNPFVSRLKLTGSVGQLGKTNFPGYAAKDTYEQIAGWYSTGPGASLIYMGNTALSWEKTNTTDLILDVGLFNDRVNFNANWYNKVTKDLVNDVDLPLSSGFGTYKDNIGKIRNRGIELYLRADLVRKKDVLFAVYGNFASNKNVLLDVSQSLQRYNELVNARYAGYTSVTGASSLYKERYSTPLTKYLEGSSVTAIYGMKSLGINPMDGREIYQKSDGTITYDWNAADQVLIGDPAPKGQGAFGFNLNYKRFSLFSSCLYQYGGQQYNYTLLNKVENVDLYNRNTDRRVLMDRWRNPGDITPLKNIAEGLLTTRPTSRFMQDYNAISINSLSLGYDFKKETLKKLGMSRLRLQVNTNNLATFSTVKQERGLDYPYARTYDLSLNVGF